MIDINITRTVVEHFSKLHQWTIKFLNQDWYLYRWNSQCTNYESLGPRLKTLLKIPQDFCSISCLFSVYFSWRTDNFIRRNLKTGNSIGAFLLDAVLWKKDISMVSCQKGPTCHAYAWQIGPFWQDTLDISKHFHIYFPFIQGVVASFGASCQRDNPQGSSSGIIEVCHREYGFRSV